MRESSGARSSGNPQWKCDPIYGEGCLCSGISSIFQALWPKVPGSADRGFSRTRRRQCRVYMSWSSGTEVAISGSNLVLRDVVVLSSVTACWGMFSLLSSSLWLALSISLFFPFLFLLLVSSLFFLTSLSLFLLSHVGGPLRIVVVLCELFMVKPCMLIIYFQDHQKKRQNHKIVYIYVVFWVNAWQLFPIYPGHA